MDDAELLDVLDATVAAVRRGLDDIVDWRRSGDRPGQYGLDLVADAAAVEVLVGAGLGVLSEESGRHHPERGVWVCVDPVDGSSNASRGIPWFATSLAAVDRDGLRAAVVVNQASAVRYAATRGGGATRNGESISVAATTEVSDAFIAMNGWSPTHFGWRQYRVLGAAALDLCLVAEGAIDGYVDCADANHGPWDYLGGMLVLLEAGGVIADLRGEALVTDEHAARRAPIAAATPALLDALLAARRTPVEAG
jgi:fructose-1,6-bisphosphatase/inositol monophosphatase family enzyme